MKEAHIPIITEEMFNKVQEEMKQRTNVEIINGKPKRKGSRYSTTQRESN